MSLIAKFIGFNKYRNKDVSEVVPAATAMPKWYKDIPKFDENKVPSLKGCAPFFDAMSSGYVYVTPTDIEFTIHNEVCYATVADEEYKDFIADRDPMHPSHFPPVAGHDAKHFHWFPMWSVNLPSGYSALYCHPLNRYDLPFVTTNGIVDNDKFDLPGRIPFFIRSGFYGILPKGTPFMQVIPIKRDKWLLETEDLDEKTVDEKWRTGMSKYRLAGHSGYREYDWERKHYK